MDYGQIAAAILAAVSAGGIAYALFYPRLSGQARAEQRRREFAAPAAIRAAADREAQSQARRGQVAQSLKDIENREKARHKVTIEGRIEQAGLSWSRKQYWLLGVVLGIVMAVVLLVTSGNWVMMLVGFLVGLLGLPRWYLTHLGKKRMLRFINEFPNALDVIVRGIKSGLPLNDCLRIIANEAQEPVKSEFRLIVEAQTLGLSLTDAATKLYERMPCAEANFFGIVLAIQQKTGGNLAETLANLSRVIRERRKMRDKIKAVSMEAKASAAIIGSLPPAVAGLVYVTSPGYMDALFYTNAGRIALVGCGIWMLIGVLVMRKMINFQI
ncbi:Tight adherence protein B [Bosea sp. 62]|uniref:type II secretion system F family protein n=1 Tax=unclassified Bosea (in: a-proteobacteria) TaxID=2653178 RepID=UPI00125BF02C|nr:MULTISPECIES: type II secretion system F family protein [unclassified Bosea (in: a-proteobacteria)]CAD5284811.1 Tight adherence protein B [Bosea sp. 21B]CAD5287546.1 Tight adherence protein B [Bosea sp. 46]CAD5301616.1 Tight adherence protein B [Bosea sp. 7B]VVT51297.1 Tight adherence protein B [Bosea sp. EC-HK365B]VXB11589.1 Tight adherence protein B [Bosea sp. 62]